MNNRKVAIFPLKIIVTKNENRDIPTLKWQLKHLFNVNDLYMAVLKWFKYDVHFKVVVQHWECVCSFAFCAQGGMSCMWYHCINFEALPGFHFVTIVIFFMLFFFIKVKIGRRKGRRSLMTTLLSIKWSSDVWSWICECMLKHEEGRTMGSVWKGGSKKN